jgi:hypothetical protein
LVQQRRLLRAAVLDRRLHVIQIDHQDSERGGVVSEPRVQLHLLPSEGQGRRGRGANRRQHRRSVQMR